MNHTNTVLIVVVVLLVLLICDSRMRKGSCGAAEPAVALAQPQKMQAAVKDAAAQLYDKIKNPEVHAQSEQMERFAVCNDPGEIDRVLDCVCGDDPAASFAEHDYGKPGLDYKTFVTSQAVDSAVIQNHKEFVHGPNGAYSTGRTYSPDSHESYDPIPWSGLRRPEYVVQCNPTQVPDVDLDLYKRNRQFCFQT